MPALPAGSVPGSSDSSPGSSDSPSSSSGSSSRRSSRADAAALEVADVLNVLQSEIRPTRMRCVTLPVAVLGQALNGSKRA